MTFISSGQDVDILPTNDQLRLVSRAPRTLNFSSPSTSRRRTWVGLTMIITSLLFAPQATQAASYTGAEIIQATNAVRQANGLSSLTTNQELQHAAEAKGADMFAHQYFDHFSPSGQAPWVWIKQSGYAYTEAGENLAIDFVDGADVVPAWMKSTSHRENLLNPKFQDIGVAVLDGTMNGSTTTIVVQFFGSQKATVAPSTTTTTAPTKPVAQATAPKPIKKSVVTAPAPKAAPVVSSATPPVEVLVPQPALVQVSQPEVLGATEGTVQPDQLAVNLPQMPVQSASPTLQPQNQELADLPLLLLATFAGYMALFALAGVISYLYKTTYVRPNVVSDQMVHLV